jgi:alkylation response protein AidB-like acyl-CoA dehydrogenase
VDTADLAVVLVERSDPGVDVVPVASMGVRSLGLGTLRMNRVVVPAGRLVAGADGLTFAQRMLNARRLLLAAGLVGGMRALHEHCVEQLMSTHRYGAPLAELPSVQAALGRQLITVCTAEATLHDALPLLDTGLADPQFDTHLSAAKHAITEAAVGLGLSALRLLGGRGYLRGPAERFLRDACAMLSAAGAQDVLEIGLGLRAVTDRRPQAAPDPLDLAARRLALAEAAR